MMLSIGQLAKATRESVKTLRYWSEHGLLAAARGSNGYRYYDPDTAKRVAFIRATQRLGFTLGQIRDILTVRAEGLRPCDEVRAELEPKLPGVRSRIAELRSLEAQLVSRLASARANPAPACDDGCGYLSSVPIQS